MPSIYLVSVDVVVTKMMKWRAWKGVFAGKVVYDSFKAVGVEPQVSMKVFAPKKFKGSLTPGDAVSFKVSLWGDGVEEHVNALMQGLAEVQYVVPKMMNVQEVEVEEPPTEGNGGPRSVFFTMKHGPTYYRYHGAWVPLPAARRMVFSLFRKLSEVHGRSLENEASLIAESIEVVGGRPSFSRYKLGLGEEVPAFEGTIKYYGIMEPPLPSILAWALKYAPYVGTGSSPGMGFGTVEWVEVGPPPFEPPVQPWEMKGRYVAP